jgi:hypothetical protein
MARLRELPGPERLLLCQSLLMLPVISILLRFLGFRRSLVVLDRLSWVCCRLLPLRTAHTDPKAICRLVATAARHGVCKATCLRQSLVVWFLLRRRGLPAELRIGARKVEDRLEAHAWVESNGLCLDGTRGLAALHGDTPSPFTMFDSLIECSG